MLIYHFDTMTRQYIGQAQAIKDPVSGQFLVPADATQIKPEPPQDKAAVWDIMSGSWEYYTNYTGQKVYDKVMGNMQVVSNISFDMEGFTTKEPESNLYSWDESTDEWVIDADKLKADARATAVRLADETRAMVLAGASGMKVAGWLQKTSLAQAVIAGTATVEQTAILQTEADLRGKGETVAELAAKQLAKAGKLSAAVAMVDGHEDAFLEYIDTTTDDAGQILLVVEASKQKMNDDMSQLLAAVA